MVGVIEDERVEKMMSPGAEMSGFMALVLVGPGEEKSETGPIQGLAW